MKSKIARNITLLLSGTLGAQLITLAFTPMVTRLYGPEAFGLFGAMMASVAIVSPVATLAYPTAITLPKEDRDAKGLALLSLFIVSILTVIIVLFLLIGKGWFTNVFNLRNQETSVLLLIPLIIFCTAYLDIFQQWMIRKKAFSITAKVTVSNSLVLNISKISIGLFYPVATVLLILSAFACSLQAVIFQRHLRKQNLLIFNSDFTHSFVSIKSLAKQYLDFPVYRMPQLTLLALSQNLPVLLLAWVLGPVAAGFYTLARVTMAAPTILIGKSVGDVLYPHINEASQIGRNVTKLITKPTLILAVIGFLPFAILVYLGPQIFSLLFGTQWVTAGEYARWLGLFFYFSLLSKPALAAAPVLGMQKHIFIYEIISTVAKAGGLLSGLFLFSSGVIAVMLFSIIGAISYLVIIRWVSFSSRRC